MLKRLIAAALLTASCSNTSDPLTPESPKKQYTLAGTPIFTYDSKNSESGSVSMVYSDADSTITVIDHWTASSQPMFSVKITEDSSVVSVEYYDPYGGSANDWMPTVTTAFKLKCASGKPVSTTIKLLKNSYARIPDSTETGFRNAGIDTAVTQKW